MNYAKTTASIDTSKTHLAEWTNARRKFCVSHLYLACLTHPTQMLFVNIESDMGGVYDIFGAGANFGRENHLIDIFGNDRLRYRLEWNPPISSQSPFHSLTLQTDFCCTIWQSIFSAEPLTGLEQTTFMMQVAVSTED